MKDETRSALEQIFDQHEKKRDEASRRKAERDAQSDEFKSKFRELRDGLITESMTEMGEYIKTRGHNYRLSTHNSSESEGHGPKHDEINLWMRFKNTGSALVIPEYVIIGDSSTLFVRFKKRIPVKNNTMDDFSDGEARIENVNKEMIQEKILEIIKFAMKA